jgi:co-chaperonin GroES (HSP10)
MIHPLQGRVLLKPVAAPTATPSGIVLPERHAEQPPYGLILELGHGVARDTLLEVGQTVIFTPSAVTDVYVEDQHYIMAPHEALIGILDV